MSERAAASTGVFRNAGAHCRRRRRGRGGGQGLWRTWTRRAYPSTLTRARIPASSSPASPFLGVGHPAPEPASPWLNTLALCHDGHDHGVIDSASQRPHRSRPPKARHVFFTSDHGFSLGEFNLLMDKRHAYDFNTRVPPRGRSRHPGYARRRNGDDCRFRADHPRDGRRQREDAARETRSTRHTRCTRRTRGFGARGAAPSVRAPMDGRSMLPSFGSARTPMQRRSSSSICSGRPTPARRQLFLAAPSSSRQQARTPTSILGALSLEDAPTAGRRRKASRVEPGAMCTQECYATEDVSNSFAALRERDGTLYIEGGRHGWGENAEWRELYRDRWQTSNLVDAEPVEANRMRAALHGEWIGCRGDACP